MNFDFLMFSSLEKQSRLENSIKIQNNQIMSSLFLIKKETDSLAKRNDFINC